MNTLRELFHYHTWATLQLLDHCKTVPSDVLDQPVAGTYGPILPTLVHLVGAEQRYLEYLTGHAIENQIRRDETRTLDELRAYVVALIPVWEALLDGIDTLDITLPARGTWPETPHAQNLLIGQALHHGNDHRTHICSALSVLGYEAPDGDVWSYWRATYLV